MKTIKQSEGNINGQTHFKMESFWKAKLGTAIEAYLTNIMKNTV